MRTRLAEVVAVLAAAGLVLSIALVWPRPDAVQTVPDLDPGPSAALPDEAPRATATQSDVRREPADVTAAGQSAPAAPVRLLMDSVDIDASVTPVGVTREGLMELPADPRVMGWYEFGPPPGSKTGSVVMAGHLDSVRFGIGPLVRLSDIDVGDRVEVARSDGSTSTYRVDRVERFDQRRLPDEVFSRTGPERLRIITCAGDYDPTMGYEENLVVTALPV